jgi:hypothetical protein
MVYANHDDRCGAGTAAAALAGAARARASTASWPAARPGPWKPSPRPALAGRPPGLDPAAGRRRAVDPAAGRLRAGRRPARAQGAGTGARAHRRPEAHQPAPDRRRAGAQAHRKGTAGERTALPPAGGDVVRLVLGTGRAAALRRRHRRLHGKIRHRRRAHPRQDALGIRARPGRQRNGREHIAAIEAREPFKNLEYRALDDHGEERWFCVSGQPMFDDAAASRATAAPAATSRRARSPSSACTTWPSTTC